MKWTAESLPEELLDTDVHPESIAIILNIYDALRDHVLWEHVTVQQHLAEHMQRMDGQT